MCFVYRIKRRAENIAVLEHITELAENGEIVLVTSVFTTAEVAMVEDKDDPNPLPEAEQERLIVDFFENDFIYPVSVTPDICKKAREIVRKYRIKGKDAIHVASALVVPGVVEFHTYDGPVLKKCKTLHGCTLKVMEPTYQTKEAADAAQQSTMFADEVDILKQPKRLKGDDDPATDTNVSTFIKYPERKFIKGDL